MVASLAVTNEKQNNYFQSSQLERTNLVLCRKMIDVLMRGGDNFYFIRLQQCSLSYATVLEQRIKTPEEAKRAKNPEAQI